MTSTILPYIQLYESPSPQSTGNWWPLVSTYVLAPASSACTRIEFTGMVHRRFARRFETALSVSGSWHPASPMAPTSVSKPQCPLPPSLTLSLSLYFVVIRGPPCAVQLRRCTPLFIADSVARARESALVFAYAVKRRKLVKAGCYAQDSELLASSRVCGSPDFETKHGLAQMRAVIPRNRQQPEACAHSRGIEAFFKASDQKFTRVEDHFMLRSSRDSWRIRNREGYL